MQRLRLLGQAARGGVGLSMAPTPPLRVVDLSARPCPRCGSYRTDSHRNGLVLSCGRCGYVPPLRLLGVF